MPFPKQRSAVAVVSNFLPSRRAPLFPNGPWPAGTNLSVSIMGLPSVSVDATEMGLCGGMAFLARDIFESNTPQLRGRHSELIPVALAEHILGRLIQSFNGPSVVSRWLSLTRALDHDTAVWGRGVFHQTVLECPAIMHDIDSGVLSLVGLVLAQSYAPWAVFENHVVL